MQTAEETRLNCWPLRKQSEIQLLIGLFFRNADCRGNTLRVRLWLVDFDPKCWLQKEKSFRFFILVLWHLSTEFNNFSLLLIFFCIGKKMTFNGGKLKRHFNWLEKSQVMFFKYLCVFIRCNFVVQIIKYSCVIEICCGLSCSSSFALHRTDAP